MLAAKRRQKGAAWGSPQAAVLNRERVTVSIRARSEWHHENTISFGCLLTNHFIASNASPVNRSRNVNAKEIIDQIQSHIARCNGVRCRWIVGIRLRARIHPYDGEELEFSTSGWTMLEADSRAEALSALNELIGRGYEQAEENHTGTRVFAFMAWPNQN